MSKTIVFNNVQTLSSTCFVTIELMDEVSSYCASYPIDQDVNMNDVHQGFPTLRSLSLCQMFNGMTMINK